MPFYIKLIPGKIINCIPLLFRFAKKSNLKGPGITESKRKLLCIFIKIQYNSNE